MRFGFLITARCNAACVHCTSSCGPHETTALPKSKIINLMDEAAEIWKKEKAAGEALYFSISGGEPFLDFAQLLEIVRYGSGLGAHMSCVTNGYWASSDDKARQCLAALKQAGLARLAVSTSRFHQQFVKVERVERALRVAGEVGVRTTVKIPLTVSDKKDRHGLKKWAKTCGADRREIFPVMPYLRRGAVLPDEEYIREKRLPGGRCPSAAITIAENGTAYPCCMPGAFVDFLALGNVAGTSLPEIYNRFYLRPQQQALRHRGPAHFARAIIAEGEGHRLRKRYEGVCDLCAHIASDTRMSAIAREASEKFATRRMEAVIRDLKGSSNVGLGLSAAFSNEGDQLCLSEANRRNQ